jgi:DNA-binding transcriptional LysR family regulator
MLRFSEIEDEFHASKGVLAGLVRLTTPEDIGGAIVAPLIAELCSVYPSLQIEMICSDERFDLVQSGIDLGLRIGKLHDSSLKARKIGITTRICVAAPGYLKRAGTPRDPVDLKNYDCINLTLGTSVRDKHWQLTNGRQQVSVSVQPRLTSNHTGAAIALTLGERGISCVPSPMVVNFLRSGELVRVLPNWGVLASPVHLVYPSQRNLAPRVKVLIDFLEDRLPGYF